MVALQYHAIDDKYADGWACISKWFGLERGDPEEVGRGWWDILVYSMFPIKKTCVLYHVQALGVRGRGGCSPLNLVPTKSCEPYLARGRERERTEGWGRIAGGLQPTGIRERERTEGWERVVDGLQPTGIRERERT